MIYYEYEKVGKGIRNMEKKKDLNYLENIT